MVTTAAGGEEQERAAAPGLHGGDGRSGGEGGRRAGGADYSARIRAASDCVWAGGGWKHAATAERPERHDRSADCDGAAAEGGDDLDAGGDGGARG